MARSLPVRLQDGRRPDKKSVRVTTLFDNGAEITGDLYLYRNNQRLQELLNQVDRRFLPLRGDDGRMRFINRNFVVSVVEETAGSTDVDGGS